MSHPREYPGVTVSEVKSVTTLPTAVPLISHCYDTFIMSAGKISAFGTHTLKYGSPVSHFHSLRTDHL